MLAGAHRRVGLRRTSVGTCVMLIAQPILGVGVPTDMAVFTGVAFLCYLGKPFAVPPGPTTAGRGGRDD